MQEAGGKQALEGEEDDEDEEEPEEVEEVDEDGIMLIAGSRLESSSGLPRRARRALLGFLRRTKWRRSRPRSKRCARSHVASLFGFIRQLSQELVECGINPSQVNSEPEIQELRKASAL